MIVTRDYLLAHRTAKKAWTKAQFDILRLNYPPVKGWMMAACGRQLTEKEAKLFEDAKFEISDNKLARVKREIRNFSAETIAHLAEWIRRL